MNEKQTRIVEAFMCLATDNPNLNEISVKMIAEKAGIGKGTVYEYFDSKDEVIQEAVVLIIDSMFKNYLVDDYKGLNYEESLRHFIDNSQIAAEKVGEYSRYNSFTIRETFKYINMKDFLHSKIISLLLENVKLFKDRVVSKGINEGLIEDLDDLKITTIVKVILRDLTENNEFKMVPPEELKDALFWMAYKLLKK